MRQYTFVGSRLLLLALAFVIFSTFSFAGRQSDFRGAVAGHGVDIGIERYDNSPKDTTRYLLLELVVHRTQVEQIIP